MEQFEEETQTALERKTILTKHFLDEAVKRFGEKEFQEALEQLLVVITLVREMTGAVNKERFRQREAVSPEKAQRRIPPRHVMWYELKDKYLPRAALLLKGPGPGSPAAGRHWENNSGSPAAGGRGGKGTAAPQTKPPTSIAELDLSIRAENCLRRVGIETVEQLTETPVEELKKIRNFGARCLQEVKEKLAARNLYLREE